MEEEGGETVRARDEGRAGIARRRGYYHARVVIHRLERRLFLSLSQLFGSVN